MIQKESSFDYQPNENPLCSHAKENCSMGQDREGAATLLDKYSDMTLFG